MAVKKFISEEIVFFSPPVPLRPSGAVPALPEFCDFCYFSKEEEIFIKVEIMLPASQTISTRF